MKRRSYTKGFDELGNFVTSHGIEFDSAEACEVGYAVLRKYYAMRNRIRNTQGKRVMENVNIESLVEDIATLTVMHKSDRQTWADWCSVRGFGRGTNGSFIAMAYPDVATGLYTLKAYLRGRLHRLNPPALVRDFNRSMRETDRSDKCMRWNRIEWNRTVALKFAEYYPTVLEVAAVEELIPAAE